MHEELNELLTKPSWANAPAWAKWLAQDESGKWYWYPARPLEDSDEYGGFWRPDFEADFEIEMEVARRDKPNPDWRDTLEQRPAAPPPEPALAEDVEKALKKVEVLALNFAMKGRNPQMYRSQMEGDAERLRSAVNDLRPLLSRLQQQGCPEGSIPECVRKWYDAKKEHIAAVHAYNSRLAFVKEHMPFGTSVDPEYQAMCKAQRRADSLVLPMFDTLSELLSAAPADKEEGNG